MLNKTAKTLLLLSAMLFTQSVSATDMTTQGLKNYKQNYGAYYCEAIIHDYNQYKTYARKLPQLSGFWNNQSLRLKLVAKKGNCL